MDLLGSAMRATEQSHTVVSQNIANVNTPGYHAKRVEFDRMLQQLQGGGVTDSVDVPVAERAGLEERMDGNNVNLEMEVSALKKNAMEFQTYSHLLASKVATMRRAISG